jgi:prophage tail gpP-like protein
VVVIEVQIQIYVKSRGRVITLSVNSSDTVFDVMEKISEKEGIPVHQQMLMFNGKRLSWRATLADYNIKDKSTLDLIPRMMED